MTEKRIRTHPVLEVPSREEIIFNWDGEEVRAFTGETIASALIASGIQIFGYHHSDHSPQGIFCANGQCSQCLVIADGQPVKACMEMALPGMDVRSLRGLPEAVKPGLRKITGQTSLVKVPVLIIGGGPAGLSAAIELGKLGIHTLLVDDKHKLGGKLLLQTHRFFGSKELVYAGERGIHIADILSDQVSASGTAEVWLNSPAVAVFSDRKVGILREGQQYVLVEPDALMIATGAKEKSASFPGNTLPGVMGAGAFQTLMNRDMVKPGQKVFVMGGGNVGLITGYHAMQAGIEVVGLCEALPECSGYKVHRDKLARLGVPIFPSHIVKNVDGNSSVEAVKIIGVDREFNPIPGTEKSFSCDCLLVAVGLTPNDELQVKGRQYGMRVFSAGDAAEIAEASAAMLSGRSAAVEIAEALGLKVEKEQLWEQEINILKSKPGVIALPSNKNFDLSVFPVIHCRQEIPCDPCAAVCPLGLIKIPAEDIRKIPVFDPGDQTCSGCRRCLAACPGLAITLVDYRKDPEYPVISIPCEFNNLNLKANSEYLALDEQGNHIGQIKFLRSISLKDFTGTSILEFQAPRNIAMEIAGVDPGLAHTESKRMGVINPTDQNEVVCRCERVSKEEIKKLIMNGCRDMNEIKALTRAGMGACGGKTCESLIFQLFHEMGVPEDEIIPNTLRPLLVEVPVGFLARHTEGNRGKN